MQPVRIATSADLRSIHDHEVSNGFTRRLTDYTLEHLDPDGTHLLILKLANHHAAKQQPFHRVEVVLALAGEELPSTLYLDVPVADWEKLRTLEEAYAIVVEVLKEGDLP
jgi:hypothetical protein